MERCILKETIDVITQHYMSGRWHESLILKTQVFIISNMQFNTDENIGSAWFSSGGLD